MLNIAHLKEGKLAWITFFFYCCKELKRLVNDLESSFRYSSRCRFFIIGRHLLKYCSFCSKPFPVILNDFRSFILKEELGIPPEDYYEFKEQGKVPKEFFSDEWWKKRTNHPRFPNRQPTPEEEIKADIDEKDWLSQEQKAEELEKELSNYAKDVRSKGWFCCVRFQKKFDPKDEDCRFSPYQQNCSYYPVFYEPEKRRFKLSNFSRKELIHKWPQRNNQTFRKLHFFIKFCPECGSRLPQSLAKEWFEVVREKFGITDLSDYKAISKLPEKYLTEEWWREAGL